MIKWLLKKCIPYDSLVAAAVDKTIDKANELMKATNGREELVKKLTKAVKDASDYTNTCCEYLADAEVDDRERAEIKATFTPFILELIKKAMA